MRLLVVFDRLVPFDADRLRRAIGAVDALPDVRAEIVTEALEGTTHGLAGWGSDEVVHVDGASQPPDQAVLGEVLGHAPSLDTRVRDRARAGRGHVVLTYVGRAAAPDVRFLALAVVAAALASFPEAVLVGNRSAQTSVAATDLRRAAASGVAGLREVPRLALACGFDTFAISGWRGLWSRTYGAASFDLPDLARHSPAPESREHLTRLFTAIHDYLRTSGATIRPDDLLEAGDARLVVRAPRPVEGWLRSPGPLLVLEDRVGPAS